MVNNISGRAGNEIHIVEQNRVYILTFSQDPTDARRVSVKVECIYFKTVPHLENSLNGHYSGKREFIRSYSILLSSGTTHEVASKHFTRTHSDPAANTKKNREAVNAWNSFVDRQRAKMKHSAPAPRKTKSAPAPATPSSKPSKKPAAPKAVPAASKKEDDGLAERALKLLNLSGNPTAREILGVSATAGRNEIRKAWFQKSRQFHPDKSKIADKAASVEAFKMVQKAKETLIG